MLGWLTRQDPAQQSKIGRGGGGFGILFFFGSMSSVMMIRRIRIMMIHRTRFPRSGGLFVGVIIRISIRDTTNTNRTGGGLFAGPDQFGKVGQGQG
jgi:hypothetical protein